MYKTLKEVSEELGVTRSTVWKWAKRLEIKGYASEYDARERLFSIDQQQQLREIILRQKRIPREK